MTVGQLNIYIKDMMAQDPILGNVCVKGEISNFKRHTSGHLYMSLKDDTGVVRAVMFRSAAAGLSFSPENGMRVQAVGRVAVYERDGQYQLYINSMRPDGLGDLHAAFERLKKKLTAEGIFAAEHKKPLPKYPKCVGVVTAPTGAAVRDIINILLRRFPYAEIKLYPSLVQGEGAAENIVRAIEYFNEKKCADVLIVGRGGGSIEDLWAFNEEAVAMAIYNSEIPIISAVGHETDFTIADFAADMRAPTPSAAAELAVPSQLELAEKFGNVYTRLAVCSRRILENGRMRLDNCRERPSLQNPILKINDKRLYVDHTCKMFENAAERVLNEKKRVLGINASRLDGLSPLGALSRGFSVVKGEDGKVVKSAKSARVGSEVSITVNDGIIDAEITKVHERDN